MSQCARPLPDQDGAGIPGCALALQLAGHGIEVAPSDGRRLLEEPNCDPIVIRQSFGKHHGSVCAVALTDSLSAIVAGQGVLGALAAEGRIMPDTIEGRDGDDRAVLLLHGRPAARLPHGLKTPRGFACIRGPISGDSIADLPEWLAAKPEPQSEAEENGTPGLSSVTFDDLEAIDFPERAFLLEPHFGEAEQVMIVGPKSRGKSFVTIGTAAAVASGSRLWRWSAPRPRRVLFIDGEMGGRRVRERLRLFRAGGLEWEPANLRVVTPDLQKGEDFVNLARPDGRAAVEHVVEDLGGRDLIIFDNISVLYRGRDLNKEESWSDWQEWLLRWRRRGVATFTALHVGKDEERGGRSHSKYRDVLDAEIQIGTPRGANANGLHFTMKFSAVRDFGHDMGPVEIQLRDGEWIVSTAKEDAPADRRGKLLAAVTAEPGITENRLLAAVGGNEDDARDLRDTLEKAGEILVERGGKGRPTKHYPRAA